MQGKKARGKMPDSETPCAWVKLYHPSGVDVRLPIPMAGTVGKETWAAVLVSVTTALEAGWLANAVGAEEGETIVIIGAALRHDVDGRDGSLVPRIDLYEDGQKFRIVSVYLNTNEDVAAFEKVSGFAVFQMPNYIGQGYIERGANSQTDRLIVKAPRPFKVCYRQNPNHNPAETDISKKKPARLFTRWPDLATAPPAGGAGSGPAPEELAKIDKPQVDVLSDLFARAGITDFSKFFGHFRISRLTDLPLKNYDEVATGLRKKVAEIEAARAAENNSGQGPIPF